MSDSETTDSVSEKPATPTRRKRTTASKSKEGVPSTQTRRRRTSTEDLSDAVPSSSRRRRSSAADENASADSAPTRSTRRAASEDADQSAPNKVDEGTSPSQPAQQHRRRTRRIETGTDALAAHESATPASERQDSSSTGERRPKGRVKRHQSQNRFERGDNRSDNRTGNAARSGTNSSRSNGNGNRQQGNGNGQNRRQQRYNRPDNASASPKLSIEDLSKLKVAELREKADALDIDWKGLLKADLVKAVYDATLKKDGFVEAEGVLDVLADGYGFLRTEGYLPSEHDVYVGTSLIRRQHLRKGDRITGQIRPARSGEKYGALQRLYTVNGIPADEVGERPRFKDLTPVYPDERLVMEHGRTSITSRVIDLAAPIGKGQRGLIVSPPKAGKTTVLKQIAASIAQNNPECHLMCLLVDERPEEVTDMQRSVHGEVISSTFDMPAENHIAVAEMVIERAKRLVEMGKDVVILLDSITRLARAYNLAQPASGRILSGGVDSTALYPPKRFLGAARNIEFGGSLTILASALIDTGSKMDEVIFEEFKGTGNMELKLDRNLADRRIYPAIDPVASGTRKEDLLLDQQEAPLIWAVRRILANMNNTERSMDMLIKSLKQTETNQEFLLRTAKKAQGRRLEDNLEL